MDHGSDSLIPSVPPPILPEAGPVATTPEPVVTFTKSMLDPAVRLSWRWSNVITTVIFGSLMLGAELTVLRSVIAPPLFPGLLALAVMALIGICGQVFVEKQYRNWAFELTPQELIVEYGVVWRTQRSVPRPRIQHVSVNSGPIDRRLGLVSLSAYTAGAEATITIPGLTQVQAEAMRSALVRKR